MLHHHPVTHASTVSVDDGPDSLREDAPVRRILEVLGEHVAQLDRAVRWQAVQACRLLLGEPMEAPGIRRTRRR